jgi:hypothetical protein
MLERAEIVRGAEHADRLVGDAANEPEREANRNQPPVPVTALRLDVSDDLAAQAALPQIVALV